MLEPDLLEEIRTFSPREKRELLTFLLRELDAGDGDMLAPSAHYEVWSPYDAADAARQLQKLLESPEEAGQ